MQPPVTRTIETQPELATQAREILSSRARLRFTETRRVWWWGWWRPAQFHVTGPAAALEQAAQEIRQIDDQWVEDHRFP